MSESRETMQNLMWRQGQSGLGSGPQITPQIFMGMLMTTSRFLMSGLNLWLHTGLSDLDVLTVVIILVSSVRQAGGLNLPQLDWLMFSLSFPRSLQKCFCGFVKGKKAHSLSLLPCQQQTCHWKCFPFEIFLYPLGNVGALGLWTDLFVHSFSTQVHVRFLQWLRATNVLDWGQTFKHYSLLHYVCISVLSPSFMRLCGQCLRGQTVLVQNCVHSMHC